jgi:hypothetical protein
MKPAMVPKVSKLGKSNYTSYVRPQNLINKKNSIESEPPAPNSAFSRNQKARELLKSTSPNLRNRLEFIERE